MDKADKIAAINREVKRRERVRDAAEQLLAALKQIVADWDSVPEDDPLPDEINDTDHWDAARAALRAAEPATGEGGTMAKTKREPCEQSPGRWVWYRGTCARFPLDADLPRGLFNRLTGGEYVAFGRGRRIYPTRDAAMSALEVAIASAEPEEPST